ncbi:MAG: hypothetical protein ACRDEA_00450, partial [Microcystaceae cyanobacterium]
MNRIKLLIQKLSLRKAIIGAIISLPFLPLYPFTPLPLWAQPIQPQVSPSTAANQEEPDFSGVGRPGRQTSGESRGNCPL